MEDKKQQITYKFNRERNTRSLHLNRLWGHSNNTWRDDAIPSISSTIYEQIFHTKVLWAAFFYFHVTGEKLPKRLLYEKFANKMLMKLTPCHYPDLFCGFRLWFEGFESFWKQKLIIERAANIIWMASLLFEFIVYIRCRHLITKVPQAL